MPIRPFDVIHIAEKLDVVLSDDQSAQMTRYIALLIEWNSRVNLTAIDDDEGILTRHLADSLTVIPTLDRCLGSVRSAPVIDVGTGGGLPGIPVKIARPALDVTLMDSTGKKIRFCQTVIDELGLDGIHAIHGRAEEMAHRRDYREQFGIVLARAVAPLPTLVEYLLPFAKPGGWCIAMKGAESQAEADRAGKAITTLGGGETFIEPVALPGVPDRRALVVIRKARRTPDLYPRQAGAPRSSPL